MPAARSVLIVDATHETRQVLRELVERVGAEPVAVARPEQAIALAVGAAPDLIVVDAESDASAGQAATRELCEAAGRRDTPVLMLGGQAGSESLVGGAAAIAKPYHYGPLARKIQRLLESRRVA
ncbi:MAG: response regulator [Planctomycetota bacterium]